MAGIAASAVTFAPVSGGTPALSSEPVSPSGRLIASVFGTIHSQTDEHSSSASSQIPKVRLASLEPDFMTGTVSAASERPKDRAYFDQPLIHLWRAVLILTSALAMRSPAHAAGG
jgi:hypothetical protein